MNSSLILSTDTTDNVHVFKVVTPPDDSASIFRAVPRRFPVHHHSRMFREEVDGLVVSNCLQANKMGKMNGKAFSATSVLRNEEVFSTNLHCARVVSLVNSLKLDSDMTNMIFKWMKATLAINWKV